jgi:recombination protein RecT
MSETPQELLARPQGLVREATGKLTDFLGRYRGQIIQILPKHMTPERVLKLIVGELNRTPALMQCSPMSVVNCVLHAASLGLEIRPRSAYLIPYSGTCQLLVDYRGKIELCLRSGLVEDVEARLVYEGDEFNIQFGTEPKMIHVPKFDSDESKEAVKLGYAICWYKQARRPHVEIMSVRQIEAIRSKSRSKDKGPWISDWHQMARKTLIHRLANYIPQSPELAHSQDVDDSLETGNPLPSFLDVIEPTDEKPLIEASAEEQQRVMEEKLAQNRDAAAAKKEAKRAAPKPVTTDTTTMRSCSCISPNCQLLSEGLAPDGRFCRERVANTEAELVGAQH